MVFAYAVFFRRLKLCLIPFMNLEILEIYAASTTIIHFLFLWTLTIIMIIKFWTRRKFYYLALLFSLWTCLFLFLLGFILQ
jgi:hypothetical protein